jgi:cyanate permease
MEWLSLEGIGDKKKKEKKENYRGSANFWAVFSTVPFMHWLRQIIGWATVWATFPQTRLVTLLGKDTAWCFFILFSGGRCNYVGIFMKVLSI